MKFRFKVSGILIIFALLLASTPTSIVHSQMGGGYICGQFQRLDAGTRGFPAFVPFGSDSSGWWVIQTLSGNLLITSTGEEIDPIDNYGRNIRIWNPDFSSGGSLISVGSYEFVNSCEPVIEFMSDKYTVLSGECLQLWWNVDASGLDAVYLDGQNVSPIDQTTVCPNTTTTYTLQVSTSYNQYSSNITVYVEYPSNTPEPTSRPVPPSATPIPPTPKPISTLIVPPPATQSNALELNIAPVNQHLSPAITLSNGLKDYGEYDCFIASMSMALEYFRNQNILNENDTTNYRSLVPIVRGTTPPSIGVVGDPAFVSTVTNNKLSASASYTTSDNLSNAIEIELKAGRPIVTSVPNWNLLTAHWAGRVAHSIFVYGLHDGRLYYVDPWDGNRYDMPIQDFVNANTWPDGSFLITFTSPQQ